MLTNSKEKAKKAEIFIDIHEKMYMLFSSNGYVLNSGVAGAIVMKSHSSKLDKVIMHLSPGLVIKNDSTPCHIRLDDVNFHECVDSSNLDSDRSLVVNVPLGESTVMNYRVAGDCHEPFRVYPFISRSDYTLVQAVTVSSKYMKQVVATTLRVCFKVPKGVDSISHSFQGTVDHQVDYDTITGQVSWQLSNFYGQTDCCMTSTMSMSSLKAAKTAPIRLSFEIPMFNISNLKVVKVKGEPDIFIKYRTTSESYSCRT